MNNHGARERTLELGASAAKSAALAEALIDTVRTHAGSDACEWIERVFATSPPLEGERFTTAFAATARRVGRRALEISAREAAQLCWIGAREFPSSWTLDELVRAVLLVRAASVIAPAEFHRFVEECYARGDNRERCAVLRALALLPQPERFAALAVEACRSSIAPVFEAVACENPYPAAYFPEINFNQMVLKALFTGVALQRIVNLQARITPELRRMAADYASERRAAGRSVPPDIEWLLNQAST